MESPRRDSVAAAVHDAVVSARPGTFFRRGDFDGSDRAVETALSRLASKDELIRVRRGLYWRGKHTRFGMTRPSPLDVALAVAGPGAGPAGIAAAHWLGLTTQVPSVVEVATPGKVPEPMPGVRFRSRPYERRLRELRPAEVAVLEVLRDPGAVEAEWPVVREKVAELVAKGSVRKDTLTQETCDERHRAARALWADLVTT